MNATYLECQKLWIIISGRCTRQYHLFKTSWLHCYTAVYSSNASEWVFTETAVTIFHIDDYFTPGPSNKDGVGGCGGNQIESHFSNLLFKLLCCSMHAKRVSSPGEAQTSKRLFIFPDIATFFTHHLLFFLQHSFSLPTHFQSFFHSVIFWERKL